jgi:hypothetical protein
MKLLALNTVATLILVRRRVDDNCGTGRLLLELQNSVATFLPVRRGEEDYREKERLFLERLGEEYVWPAERGAGYDLASRDGVRVIEFKLALHGVRDFHAAFLQLAFIVERDAHIQRALLVTTLPTMRAQRAHDEWRQLERALKPHLMHRLALVALTRDQDLVLPDQRDPHLLRVLAAAKEALGPASSLEGDAELVPWSPKTFEVWRVLLAAWLRKEGPLPLHEVQRRSGCSHPTVSIALSRLQERGELTRTSSRSVALESFPRRSLNEVAVLANAFRQTRRYVDASGRRPDPVDLLERLNAQAPLGVAVGGVSAARHYEPDFDLNGLPRLDVTTTRVDERWIKDIDPALRRVGPEEASPVLVVHFLRRPEPLFEKGRRGRLPFTDPAETLLDLYDLRLTTQAGEFVEALRREGNRHA